MTGREQPFQELLGRVDRDEGGGAQQPQGEERAGVPRDRGLAGERASECAKEQADGQCDQDDDPRDDRVQVRGARPLELDARSAAVGEELAKLVDGERGRREKGNRN